MAGITARSAHAAELCNIPTPAGPGCEVGIRTANFLPVQKQMSQVTCWAASFSNLLLYSNVHLPEPVIVAQVAGQPRLADPMILNAMLNRSYVDATGKSFQVSARATDNFFNTVRQINNADIYAALKADIPIFYSDDHHSMVVLQVLFVPSPAGPAPVDVVAADPDPNAPSIRHLAPNEIQGMYAAIVSVQ